MLKLKMKYLAITMMVMVVGCTTNKTEPEFAPLPPEKLFDNLLHEDRLQNIAYKSITIEDIVIKEYCG